MLFGVMVFTVAAVPLAGRSVWAEDTDNGSKAEKYPRAVTVNVVDKDTRAPLAGATVTVRVDDDERESKTDAAGSCSVEFSVPPERWLSFAATHKGYVRDSVSGKPEKMLRSDRPHTIRLEKGVPIGGVIVDESGEPIEGVRVTFWLQVRNIQVDTVTDAAGGWELSVPKEETKPSWQLQHPDFALSTTFSWIGITDELRAGQHRHSIERGLRVEGVVVDEGGAPVEGAFVIRGHADFDTYAVLQERIESGEVQNAVLTGVDGRFSIPAEADTETMVVCAGQFAPAMFQVNRDGSEHRVVLGKGETWTGRVQDASGAGIEGASVRCYQWKYHLYNRLMMRPYKAETDADGNFAMPLLPDSGPLDMSARMEGFFDRDVESGELDVLPTELTLHPSAPLQGRVYDAETGEPVKAFTVDYGFSKAAHSVSSYYCHDPYLKSSKEGKFSIETGLDLGEEPGALWVRVWARDYYPTFIDPVWALDFESKPLEVALEPGEPILGKVLTPGGEGAKGVTMALVHQDEKAVVQGYQIGMNYVGAPYNIAKSRASGRFRLAPSKEPALILALHESGWAVRPMAEHEPGGDLPLSAWCTLEGKVPLAGRPEGENAYVRAVVPMQKEWGKKEPISFSLSSTADASGHFGIEHVPALPLRVGENRRWLMSHVTGVTPKSGETLQVEFGDPSGGALRGQIIVDGLVNPQGSFREPWHASRRFLIAARPKGAEADDEYANYIPLVQEDGAFTLGSLPAGEYELTITAHEKPPENACGRGTPRARATRTFTIDAGHSNPLDLGSVQLERIVTVGAKDRAPEIEGTPLTGEAPWKLSSEYANGKPILLVFWATWCMPCKAEIPLLKELWEAHGKGERLQVIGLNLDRDKPKAAKFATAQGLPWPQYNVGAWGESNPVTNAYGVAYIPSNWLIGPGGDILADRIPSDALEEGLEEYLSEP